MICYFDKNQQMLPNTENLALCPTAGCCHLAHQFCQFHDDIVLVMLHGYKQTSKVTNIRDQHNTSISSIGVASYGALGHVPSPPWAYPCTPIWPFLFTQKYTCSCHGYRCSERLSTCCCIQQSVSSVQFPGYLTFFNLPRPATATATTTATA